MNQSRAKSLRRDVDRTVDAIARRRRAELRVGNIGRIEAGYRRTRIGLGRAIGRFGLFLARPFVAVGKWLATVPPAITEDEFDAVIEKTRAAVYRRLKRKAAG